MPEFQSGNVLKIDMLITCPCNHCGNNIEFEATEFEETGGDSKNHFGQTVQCPHCKKLTILSLKKKLPWESEQKSPLDQKSKSGHLTIQKAELLSFASIIMFCIGCGLVANGCSGEFNESQNPDGSAIRQILNAVQYSSGFIVISISLVIRALLHLIRK